MAKALGIFIVILFTISAIIYTGYGALVVEFNWEKNYMAYWNLADKSSTIDAKAEYISQFYEKLSINRQDFADNNAIFLKTNDNSLDYNLKALNSLRERLDTIKGMNESDFAYQTAIQQITAQEQGEAQEMIGVIHGCYILGNYPFYWNWIATIVILVWTTLLGIIGYYAFKGR